jgi:hypothetical protein
VDTLGLLLTVKVIPANWSEVDCALVGLEGMNTKFGMLEVMWADGGFNDFKFRSWVKGMMGCELEITKSLSKPGQVGFKPAPRHWVVEAIPPVRCVLGSRTNDCVVGSESAFGS